MQLTNVGISEKQSTDNKQDFQWAFGLNRLSLNLLGVWPREAGDRYYSFKIICIPLMILMMLIALFLPQMYALSYVYRQLPLVIDNLIISGATFTSSLKLLLLWNSRQVLRPVIYTVENDWMSIENSWEHKIMTRQAKRGRIFTISGYIITFCCCMGFITPPFFGISVRIINNITDVDYGRYFPLQTYYPYEATISPYFELTYASQLIAATFVAISFSVPDNFFGALVFHASAQCEILEAKMSKLLPENFNRVITPTGVEKKFVQMKLKRLVNEHVQLIKFVGAVENSFNLCILSQVFCLLLLICCLAFGVIKSIKTDSKGLPVIQLVTLTGTLLDIMIHMFVYCFASEILAQHSLGFFYAIYYSDWFLLPSNISRDIIIVMIRSRSELKLTAGKFFCLSFELYLKILKTSFSFISVLLAATG